MFSVTDSRGTLASIDIPDMPFRPKRLFWIYGVPDGEQRGAHAHKTCEQFIVALFGKFEVTREWFDKADSRELTTGDSVYIPALCWTKIQNISTDAVILVLCSEDYDPADYIRNKEELKCLA